MAGDGKDRAAVALLLLRGKGSTSTLRQRPPRPFIVMYVGRDQTTNEPLCTGVSKIMKFSQVRSWVGSTSKHHPRCRYYLYRNAESI